MSTHTPGPWEIVGEHYITGNVEYVAMVDESTVSPSEMRANTRLIAAAPDLLAALIRAEKWMSANITAMALSARGSSSMWERENAALCTVRAAIAKAEGRS